MITVRQLPRHGASLASALRIDHTATLCNTSINRNSHVLLLKPRRSGQAAARKCAFASGAPGSCWEMFLPPEAPTRQDANFSVLKTLQYGLTDRLLLRRAKGEPQGGTLFPFCSFRNNLCACSLAAR